MDVQRAVFFDIADRHHFPARSQRLFHDVAEAHRSAGDRLIAVGSPCSGELLVPDIVLDSESWLRTLAVHSRGESAARCGSRARSLAVVEAIVLMGLNPTQCIAYGDVCTSAEVFAVVGNPRAIACNPEAAATASLRGWPLVSAATPF